MERIIERYQLIETLDSVFVGVAVAVIVVAGLSYLAGLRWGRWCERVGAALCALGALLIVGYVVWRGFFAWDGVAF